ncbi:hypothetical protein [Nereida sp. MMG025]|uniref:hypothetical protein n=1 Tax=Nereida sp. MMG025 TaxID=2909981 RepID=UPI001F3DDAC6|nr:hypothetical protein [Nereida sp. MMG025]MCF6444900.1 hypothetical protein [Nereida sp. MMG025]
MRRFQFALPILALAACDMAGPAFLGAEPMYVEVGGSAFTVRQRDDRAEVIRTNMEWAPDRGAVADKMKIAIEVTTGCTVRDGTLEGDQAVRRARLKCSGDAPYQITRRPPLRCQGNTLETVTTDGAEIELTCR